LKAYLCKWFWPHNWKASAIIGFVWGIWHAPVVLQGHNYPEYPVAGVFMMTLVCLLLAPVFSYIRLKSKSVIAAVIAHGSLNVTAALAIIMTEEGNNVLIIGNNSGFIFQFPIRVIISSI
jgi:membrane protease YdiL (CAAX protease family)